MFSKRYLALAQDENAVEAGSVEQPVAKRRRDITAVPVLCSILLVSLVVNLFSCTTLLSGPWTKSGVTEFAGLSYNTPHVIEYKSQFNNADRTAEDAAWASELIDPTTLVVALDDSFTKSRGVLHSMRWPWDSSKGVYTLNSAHELHCLHLLRKTVNQAYDGVSLEWPREHTVHCLEYLLQSVMCNADDTPLYQGLLHKNRHAEHPIGGLGDVRKCRDFNQLHTWAKQHSACYNQSYMEDDPTFPERDRYKFCPDDRKPWEDIK